MQKILIPTLYVALEGRRNSVGTQQVTNFPFGMEMPLKYAGPAPRQADFVVIGGGVIGVCTALFLARAGQSVVLFEKGRIAAEQSSRNWGWIRQQGRDPDELPIMVEANRLWRELARQANVDIGLVKSGVTYFARDQTQMEQHEAWLAHAKENNVDSRLLTSAEVAALFPQMSARFAGAITTPSDMRAEPWLAVPALADIAASEGVRIIENCAVRTLDLVAGRVAGVVTEAGKVSAERVIVAGGAWSSLFLRNHGVNIPQLSVRESVAATEALPSISEGAASGGHVAFRRRADGGYTLAPPSAPELFVGPDAVRGFSKYLPQLRKDPLGQRLWPAAPRGYPDAWGTPRRWNGGNETPFERMRVLNPKPNRHRIDRLVKDFREMFPSLPEVRIKVSWAGMIDTMPDIVPVVDRGPMEGLFIGTGMSGHGFGIGPAMGRVLAALAMGCDPGHDLTRFRFSRFTDGSAIRLPPDA